MPNLTSMTKAGFIARVENGNVEGGYTNLKVFSYYASAETHLKMQTCHYAVVADRNSTHPWCFWRVAYKLSTMEGIGISELMYLHDTKKTIAEIMLGI